METKTKRPKSEFKFEDQRFEFIFYINNHIICQRFFNIRDYDKNSTVDKELLDNITGMDIDGFGKLGIIPNFLKDNSVDYLWNTYNPYNPKIEEPGKNIWSKTDDFQFEIRIDKITVGKSTFSGNFFPPKVRYNVNIKEIIPLIVGEIRDFLTKKEYEEVG